MNPILCFFPFCSQCFFLVCEDFAYVHVQWQCDTSNIKNTLKNIHFFGKEKVNCRENLKNEKWVGWKIIPNLKCCEYSSSFSFSLLLFLHHYFSVSLPYLAVPKRWMSTFFFEQNPSIYLTHLLTYLNMLLSFCIYWKNCLDAIRLFVCLFYVSSVIVMERCCE